MRLTLPGTNNSNRVKARRWKIFWSYLPDWCLTIFLWAIFYLLDKVDGYRRVFSVTDTSLAHPFSDPERIKVWQLAIYTGVIPAIIIILTGALIRRSIWDIHSGILGLVLNLGLTVTFTDILKITAGRPRPDLYARCQLPADLTENPVHGLVNWTVCTRTDLLQDGFRSFPSGHSSFAWAGMWYLILYAAAKMRISNRRGYTWKAWILLPPLSCAALVSISRTMDYRHHSTDVIAGAIIGVLAAWFAYRQFYPPLSHPQAYKPYSPRIAKDEEIPLHSLNGRPSVEGPHSSLLPPPPAGAYPPKGEGTYGHTTYPPAAHYAANGADGYGGEPGSSMRYAAGPDEAARASGDGVVANGGVMGQREAQETVQR